MLAAQFTHNFLHHHNLSQTGNVSNETIAYLSHILKKLPDFEQFGFASAVYSFDWNFVDVPLAPLNDTKAGVQVEQNQLARRFGQTIEINKAIWKQMNVFNQVATLLHEVVYASLTPLTRPDGSQFQDSTSAIEIVGSIMNPLHQFSEASAARFKINGIPKIGFLALGDAYGLDTPAINTDHLPEVTHNSRVILWAPGKKDDQGRAFDESHEVATGQDLPREFTTSDWCKGATGAHWETLEIINSRTATTLGFKDYVDENQEYKKYFGIVNNEEYKDITSKRPGSIGHATLLLPGKSAEQCTVELNDLIQKVAQSILDVITPRQ